MLSSIRVRKLASRNVVTATLAKRATREPDYSIPICHSS